MKKIYNFINNYKIELIVILILLLISICIYYFYKKYNSYENFTTTTAISIDNWRQLGPTINGKAAGDKSGSSVALSSNGNILAIGSPSNDNSKGKDSGHVRIYEWDDTKKSWDQLGLDIDGEAANDYSGNSVALSSDGKTVAIGAIFNNGNGTKSGHVRIHQWDDTEKKWKQLGLDIDGEAGNDVSGSSVALSSNGMIVAIGAINNHGINGIASGHVRIHQWSDTEKKWKQLGIDIDGETTNNNSGISVALSSNGMIVAIGAPLNNGINGIVSGHVRIHQWDDTEKKWKQLGIDIDGEASSDNSGGSVALSSNGMIVAIGAINTNKRGRVRIFQYINGKWDLLGNDIDGEASGDQSGISVALSSNGMIVAVGAINNQGINGISSGHVRIFHLINNIWTQFGNDIDGEATNDSSGNSVALSSDGTIVAIGASINKGNGLDSGHVRIFTEPAPFNCIGDFVNTSECSKPCGGGKQKQIYQITTPAKYGGAVCSINPGVEKEIDCNTEKCQPINCVGSFVNDGVCIPSNDLKLNCGPGTQSQKYVITQPALYGGVQCPFFENQPLTVACNLPPCPIDCVGSFGEYGKCNKDCAGGKKERVYTITQKSQHNGKQCPNNDGYKEITDCNPQACPIPCVGKFEPFKPCSKECGPDGILLEQYKITTPAQYGGDKCEYENNDIKSIPCNRKPCPTYPENTAIKEALKESNNKIQNIRYDIINRQEDLDFLTNKFNRLNKNINKIKTTSKYVSNDKTLQFY